MLSEIRKYAYEQYPFFFPERIVPLHVMPVSCGYELQRSHDYIWHSRRRGPKELVIWQYTLSGRGALKFGDQQYDLTPGRALLVKVPEDSCYYLPEDSKEWEFVHFTLNGSEIVRLWDELRERNGPVAEFGENSKTPDTFLEIFRLVRKKRITTAFQASSFGYQFMMSMIEDLMTASTGALYQPEFITEAIQFCMRNLGAQINIDDIAAVSGFSRYHFCREFKHYTGYSPGEYLNELRMKQAVRMLQSERKTIKEIAFDCGFEDPSYFCKVFKKNYGISPGNFKNTR